VAKSGTYLTNKLSQFSFLTSWLSVSVSKLRSRFLFACQPKAKTSPVFVGLTVIHYLGCWKTRASLRYAMYLTIWDWIDFHSFERLDNFRTCYSGSI